MQDRTTEQRVAIEEQQRMYAEQFEKEPEIAMVASMSFVAALELLEGRTRKAG